MREPTSNSFSETPAWKQFGDGWRQLHGNYTELGFSFEWHDFVAKDTLDWGRSFHPGSIEICLNLAGRGSIAGQDGQVAFERMTAGFYRQEHALLTATREGGARHQFLTVELAPAFMGEHLNGDRAHLHPIVERTLKGENAAALSTPVRLTTEHQELVGSLRQPPVFASAQRLWYRAKTLELMAAFLFKAPPEKELFCQRQNRVAQDRVDRVISILKRDLSEPPSLETLGKEVGCSSFYLSRMFSQQMGKTISQYMRDLRMERAAELLRAGKMNVTEVAMEVGYSSSSHFSTAFHETFGCCPGLYPLPLLARSNRRH
ncbi:MAG TPA: AraC family transcriptional regulator [Candidatus Acidoferrum sp.]|nr:AraC family transcriptional regulator [Candidatus Acidoferrum sp.]